MNDTTKTIAMMKMMDLPKKKSMALALVLAFFLGWIGALYANWRWALVGLLVFVPATVITSNSPDASLAVLLVGGVTCLVISYVSVRKHNDEIDEKRRKLEAIVGMNND